jgi:hypothetical protein
MLRWSNRGKYLKAVHRCPTASCFPTQWPPTQKQIEDYCHKIEAGRNGELGAVGEETAATNYRL